MLPFRINQRLSSFLMRKMILLKTPEPATALKLLMESCQDLIPISLVSGPHYYHIYKHGITEQWFLVQAALPGQLNMFWKNYKSLIKPFPGAIQKLTWFIMNLL